LVSCSDPKPVIVEYYNCADSTKFVLTKQTTYAGVRKRVGGSKFGYFYVSAGIEIEKWPDSFWLPETERGYEFEDSILIIVRWHCETR